MYFQTKVWKLQFFCKQQIHITWYIVSGGQRGALAPKICIRGDEPTPPHFNSYIIIVYYKIILLYITDFSSQIAPEAISGTESKFNIFLPLDSKKAQGMEASLHIPQQMVFSCPILTYVAPLSVYNYNTYV